MKLLAFVNARLDEDEKIALAAALNKPETYGRWDYGGGEYNAPGRGEVYAPDASGPDSTGFMDYHYVTCDSEGLTPAVEGDEGTHIARHNPSRTLREVAAKRAQIRSTIRLIEEGWGHLDNEHIICSELRPMAEVYSDHPEYGRIEWDT